MIAGGRRDAGRVSVFLSVAFAAVLAVIGLAYDAAGQVRTLHLAQLQAAEAARAAGQAVSSDEVAGRGRHAVDEDAAVAAAESYLSAAGASGQVTFDPSLTTVTVVVTATYEPVLLGLFGAGAREVTGIATATLMSG